jgi:hypothetical protein
LNSMSVNFCLLWSKKCWKPRLPCTVVRPTGITTMVPVVPGYDKWQIYSIPMPSCWIISPRTYDQSVAENCCETSQQD